MVLAYINEKVPNSLIEVLGLMSYLGTNVGGVLLFDLRLGLRSVPPSPFLLLFYVSIIHQLFSIVLPQMSS